ncbi:hypothetical protein JKP88DRAFT_291010 [Tribonema minus]|uniref:Uncharacterized protein n=1 Tax=Tribonema minus TaxID=303371 RepID=A0A835YUM2_9STRA|nr:hypothetical protein JKP88DRAFT_291010 [Tribonema minus]
MSWHRVAAAGRFGAVPLGSSNDAAAQRLGAAQPRDNIGGSAAQRFGAAPLGNSNDAAAQRFGAAQPRDNIGGSAAQRFGAPRENIGGSAAQRFGAVPLGSNSDAAAQRFGAAQSRDNIGGSAAQRFGAVPLGSNSDAQRSASAQRSLRSLVTTSGSAAQRFGAVPLGSSNDAAAQRFGAAQPRDNIGGSAARRHGAAPLSSSNDAAAAQRSGAAQPNGTLGGSAAQQCASAHVAECTSPCLGGGEYAAKGYITDDTTMTDVDGGDESDSDYGDSDCEDGGEVTRAARVGFWKDYTPEEPEPPVADANQFSVTTARNSDYSRDDLLTDAERNFNCLHAAEMQSMREQRIGSSQWQQRGLQPGHLTCHGGIKMLFNCSVDRRRGGIEPPVQIKDGSYDSGCGASCIDEAQIKRLLHQRAIHADAVFEMEHPRILAGFDTSRQRTKPGIIDIEFLPGPKTWQAQCDGGSTVPVLRVRDGGDPTERWRAVVARTAHVNGDRDRWSHYAYAMKMAKHQFNQAILAQ